MAGVTKPEWSCGLSRAINPSSQEEDPPKNAVQFTLALTRTRLVNSSMSPGTGGTSDAGGRPLLHIITVEPVIRLAAAETEHRISLVRTTSAAK